MTSYRQPGAVLTDHRFRVPLDYDHPGGEQIEVFAREVVGGPGGCQPAVAVVPAGRPGLRLAPPDRARQLRASRGAVLDRLIAMVRGEV